MKNCPRCGFHHVDTDLRCVKCGTLLDALDQPSPLDPLKDSGPLPTQPSPISRFAALANAPMRLTGWWRILFACWRRRLIDAEPNPSETHLPDPWAAAAPGLLWPGLGQLRCRQPRKALWFALGWGACLAVAVKTLREPYSNKILMACVAYYALAWHDAFLTAQKNRMFDALIPWQKRLAYYFAWICYVGIFCTLFIWIGYWTVFRRVHVYHDDMAPWVREKEWLAAERLSFLWRPIQNGDVVFYKPESLSIEQVASEGNFDPTVINVRASNMIERVVALPGQTIEYRGGAFFRDGKPMPRDQWPIVTNQLWSEFSMTCQPRHYLILFTYLGSMGEPFPIISSNVINHATPHRMNTPGWIVRRWENACQVPQNQVWGRVWLVYNPPPSRRILD